MAISEAALAAITAGATAAGGIGSAGISSARNMKIAKYSADFQRQMIAEQNKYNSPLEQMRRYTDAGLNPHLIYGDGASAGNQQTIARYEAPELYTPDFGQILGGVMRTMIDFKLKEQELQNMKEQQFNLRSERMGKDIENAFNSVITGINPGILLTPTDKSDIQSSSRLKMYSAELQSKETMAALHEAQKELATFSAKHQEAIVSQLIPAQVRLMEARIKGEDVNREIAEIERDLNRSLDSIGGKSGVKLIIDFLRLLIK